jgi:hypothetical protein
VLHAMVQRFDGRRGPLGLTTPLLWYYGLTLAVPLVNGAAGTGATFVEYALFVFTLPLVLMCLFAVARRSERPRRVSAR